MESGHNINLDSTKYQCTLIKNKMRMKINTYGDKKHN